MVGVAPKEPRRRAVCRPVIAAEYETALRQLLTLGLEERQQV